MSERETRIVTVLSGIAPFIANRDVNNISAGESADLLRWTLEKIIKGIEKD